MKKLILLGLFFCLCFFQNSSAMATDSVAGVVKSVKGSALAVQNARVRALEAGDKVLIGDILSTGPDSRLELTMIDDGIFKLGATTSFVVVDYTFGQNQGSAVLNLLQGALEGASGQLAKLSPEGMNIETPLATIGIRGTKFFVGEFDGALNIAHWSGGGVVVKNDGGDVFLSGHQHGTLVSDKKIAPTAAKSWGQEKIAKARSLID